MLQQWLGVKPIVSLPKEKDTEGERRPQVQRKKKKPRRRPATTAKAATPARGQARLFQCSGFEGLQQHLKLPLLPADEKKKEEEEKQKKTKTNTTTIAITRRALELKREEQQQQQKRKRQQQQQQRALRRSKRNSGRRVNYNEDCIIDSEEKRTSPPAKKQKKKQTPVPDNQEHVKPDKEQSVFQFLWDRSVRHSNQPFMWYDHVCPQLPSVTYRGRSFSQAGCYQHYTAVSRGFSWSPFTTCMNRDMLASGGSRGLIHVFHRLPVDTRVGMHAAFLSGDEDDYSTPTLSIQAHDRWVSDVTFLPGSNKMLSSSDDATVALWDINALYNNVVFGQRLGQQEEKEDESLCPPSMCVFRERVHKAGIYSMDLLGTGDQLLTGSKDSNVCVTNLSNSQLGMQRCIVTPHKVVKCVKWAPHHHMFATCGNDKSVRIYDMRCSDPVVRSYDDGIHTLAVNTVRWNEMNPNHVLSSSFDKSISVVDIRMEKAPLFSIRSHWSAAKSSSRASAIIHPTFLHNGLYILASSLDNESLHLFSSQTGQRLTKIHLGFVAQQITTDDNSNNIMLTSQRRFFDCLLF